MAIKISGSTIIDNSRNIVNAGIITASSFSGDGSGLTGVTAVGSGLGIKDDGSNVGTATTIDFGSNLSVSPVSAGVVTVTASSGNVGSAGTWAVNAIGIHTSKNVGIGTELSTDALTVVGDGNFSGVVTATRFESSSAGTPTIDSPNNLNINAITVAISTDATIGGDLVVSGINTLSSGGINVAGVITATYFYGDGSNLTGLSTFSGDYNDLVNKPSIPSIVGLASEGYVDVAVAGIATFSGDYNDLVNKPTIPVNLTDLSNVNAGSPSTGHVLKWSGTEWISASDLTASGSGIGLSDLSVSIAPAGINSLSYNNSTGTFQFTPTSLVGVVTHADFTSQGLIKRGSAEGTYTIITDNSTNWNTAYGWGDHASVGYVTSLVGYATEAYVGLQTFVGAATTITTTQIGNWNTAYGWGDHAIVGYVTSGYVSNASVSYATTAGIATYSESAGVSTDVVGGQVSVTQLNVSGISTLGVTTTTHLTAQQVNVSGVVTATRFESTSAGVPTIDSPNNLNINAVTVAISTDLTIGGDITSVASVIASNSITAPLLLISGDNSIGVSTNTISGPSELIIDPDGVGDNTGLVIIKGDLQVDGTQTTINSTTLTIDDKNIVLASGAANASAADGAGISVDGANANITYTSSGDKWVFNKVPYYNLARILTVDDEGSGNGIDADTVDGFQASQFLRSDANINITNYSVGIGTTAWPVTSLGGTADFYVTNRTLWEGGSGIWTGRNYYVGVASDGITFHAPSNNSATDFAGKEFRIYTNSQGKQRFTIGDAPAWVATVISLPPADPSDPELASYLPVGAWEINGNETFQVGVDNASNGRDGFAKITKTLQIGTSFYPYSKGVFIDADRRTVAVGAAITMNGRTGIVTAVGFHGNVNAGLSTLGVANATSLSVSGVVTATSFSGSNTLKERSVVSGSTTSIVNNGIGNTDITGFKSYALMKVGLSTAGWLRLYTDSASRANDVSRSVGIDPTPGSGVIAEVVTTGISTTQIISPFVMGGNLDDPADTTIYASITNLSGTTQTITANLTILQLEA